MISSIKSLRPISRLRAKAGFTLIEIMLAAVITVVLVGILLQITTLASKTVTLSTQKLSAFATARTAFDTITKNLSQATLNTYLDYYDANGLRRTDTSSDINSAGGATFVAVCYGRASDLQFIIQPNVQNASTGGLTGNHGQEVYFQAPRSYSADSSVQSVQGLLNACGYYVQFGDSHNFQPPSVPTLKYRYRLMQGLEATESLQVFAAVDGSFATSGQTSDNSGTWLANIQNNANPNASLPYVTPLADNVIALIVWPRLSVNNDPTGYLLLPAATHAYSYDSQLNPAPLTTYPYIQAATADQLPPDLQVTMIVLDEASAIRAQGTATTAPSVVETALTGRFVKADNYATDITAVASALSASHLNFQIFSTTVALRESKWSTQQK